MPLDQTHQHSSADIIKADDPHTPISPSSGTDLAPLTWDQSGRLAGPVGAGFGFTLQGSDASDTGPYGAFVEVGAATEGQAGSAALSGGYASDVSGQAGPGIVAADPGQENGTGGGVRLFGAAAAAGSGAAGGDISLVPGAGDGAGRSGLVFPNLPTSDPGVSGALYCDALDGNRVKVSP